MIPSTPRRHQLTRDERLRIQTLYQAGWQIDTIYVHFRPHIQGLTPRQVEYTCRFTHPTPQKRSGKLPILSKEQDLNPIEIVWDWMKDYIQDRYSQYEKDQVSYPQLRRAIIEV
jgi:hypothetical protein